MLELGRLFRPVLELGQKQPRCGTVPARGENCDFDVPRAGTGRPVLELGAPCWNWTFDPNPRIITGPIVAPEPSWGTPNCHWCQFGAPQLFTAEGT